MKCYVISVLSLSSFDQLVFSVVHDRHLNSFAYWRSWCQSELNFSNNVCFLRNAIRFI